MSGQVKCRECKEVKTGESRLVMPSLSPATLCLECAEKHQRQNGTPMTLVAFVGWYEQQHRSTGSELALLRAEVQALRDELTLSNKKMVY